MKFFIAFVSILIISTRLNAQCTKDIDCKGDRICVNGKCEEPPKQKPPCTKDIDCQGDSVCDQGRCEGISTNKPAPTAIPLSTPKSTLFNQPVTPVAYKSSTVSSVKDCGMSKEEGKSTAKLTYSSGGWQVGGLASGLLLD